MKSIKRNALVVAFMFATVAGVANGPKKAFGKKANEVEKELIAIKADPVFKKKGNKLFLNLLNLDQEKVTIKVVDSEGRVVFIETMKGDLVIEKAFNFENAFENKYTVYVVDNNETFKETVEVK
ncbi:MAG: hypothetical protein AAGC45_08395 [Bacteroidota bacterium]